jgi:muconate cycloisomerase
MRIEEIIIRKIRLPFLKEFCHSLKKGLFADNIVVEIVAEGGEFRGFGECAPRPYVTGESQKSVPKSIQFLLSRGFFSWEFDDLSEIWDFVDKLPHGKEHNAALCGLEIAMLDLLGNKHHCSISEYFPQDFSCSEIHYGAVLPLAERERINDIAWLLKGIGINKLKLKMGQDFDENARILEEVETVLGCDCDLKIDVNGAWDRQTAFKHLPLISGYKIKAVEQPMLPNDPDLGDFAEALQSCGVRVMADESACELSDVIRLLRDRHYNMINVRLSKCGGFRRSLGMINYLREQRIPFQIACQLGESGILSAAGRVLSLLCKDALYHDGSYDELLLEANITESHVSFGRNGAAGPLGGSGLGVKVHRQNLEILSDPSGSVSFRRP